MDEKSYREKMAEYDQELQRGWRRLRILVPITIVFLACGVVLQIIGLLLKLFGGE